MTKKLTRNLTKMPDPVLILCRQQQTITSLANIFSKYNEPVMTAEDPVDAWECLKAGGISAIILDLSSPLLEDLTLIPKVRSCTETFDIPFLYLVRKDFVAPKYSSYGDSWVSDAWLGLPCPANQVRNVVRQLIERSASERKKDAIEEAERMMIPVEEEEGKVSEDSRREEEGKDKEPEEKPETKLDAKNIPPGILNGQLGAIEVSKILTVIEPLALTGSLVVNNGMREGRIYFQKGSVIHAELADITGPDALFLLFHMKKGSFAFEPGEAKVKHTIKSNTMALLLEGLRQMDEAKEAIQMLQTRRAARRKRAESGANLQKQESGSLKKKTVKKNKHVKTED